MKTVLFTLLLLNALWADSAHSLISKGNAEYAQGNYTEALKYYNTAAEELPESPRIAFNRGSVYYQQGNYELAIPEFQAAALNSDDFDFSAQAKFNLGNCFFKQAKKLKQDDLENALGLCEQSIKHYQDARDFKGSYQQAAENIEIVRLYSKILQDAQQKQEEQEQQEENLLTKLKDLLKRQEAVLSAGKEVSAKPMEPKLEAPQLEEETKNPFADPSSPTPEPAVPSVEELKELAAANYEQYQQQLEDYQTATAAWEQEVKGLAEEQGSILSGTQAVASEIQQTQAQLKQQGSAIPDPNQPASAQPSEEALAFGMKLVEASTHVHDALRQEQAAASFLTAQEVPEAAPSQSQAATDLKEAIEALSDDEENENEENQENNEEQEDQEEQQDSDEQEEGEQDEEQEGEENPEESEENQEGEQNEEEGEDSDEQQEPSEGEEGEPEQPDPAELGESADDILDEEKKNPKQMRPVPGRMQRVDKDW